MDLAMRRHLFAEIRIGMDLAGVSRLACLSSGRLAPNLRGLYLTLDSANTGNGSAFRPETWEINCLTDLFRCSLGKFDNLQKIFFHQKAQLTNDDPAVVQWFSAWTKALTMQRYPKLIELSIDSEDLFAALKTCLYNLQLAGDSECDLQRNLRGLKKVLIRRNYTVNREYSEEEVWEATAVIGQDKPAEPEASVGFSAEFRGLRTLEIEACRLISPEFPKDLALSNSGYFVAPFGERLRELHLERITCSFEALESMLTTNLQNLAKIEMVDSTMHTGSFAEIFGLLASDRSTVTHVDFSRCCYDKLEGCERNFEWKGPFYLGSQDGRRAMDDYDREAYLEMIRHVNSNRRTAGQRALIVLKDDERPTNGEYGLLFLGKDGVTETWLHPMWMRKEVWER